MTGTTSASGPMRRITTSTRPASPLLSCSIASQTPLFGGTTTAAYDLLDGLRLAATEIASSSRATRHLDAARATAAASISLSTTGPRLTRPRVFLPMPWASSAMPTAFGQASVRTVDFVTFASNATNLVPADSNGQPDTFVKDLQTGVIERVSIAVDGTQGNGDSSLASAISGGGTGHLHCFRQCGVEPRVRATPMRGRYISCLIAPAELQVRLLRIPVCLPQARSRLTAAFAFSDLDLTDQHTVTVTGVAVSAVGGASASLRCPGGLGTFYPDYLGKYRRRRSVRTAVVDVHRRQRRTGGSQAGQRIQQVYTVRDQRWPWWGRDAGRHDHACRHHRSAQTLTVEVLSSTGIFAPSDEPLQQMGSGTVQPGGTSTQFTIVNTWLPIANSFLTAMALPLTVPRADRRAHHGHS